MKRIKKALAALSLSLIQTTFNVGNQVKAAFVYNKATSYCPYNQADHLVDGLLWHYDEKNKKAFFILARVVENNKFKFINNSQYLEDLKKNHFTEIDINELKSNSNGGFYKYLYDSFVNARYTNPRISPKEQYPDVVESDFPLNNLAEYFDGYVNGDDYFFWRRIFLENLNEEGPIEPLKCKIYASWNGSDIFGIDSFLKTVPSDKLKFAVNKMSESLVLSHGTPKIFKLLNGHLSSIKTLRLTGGYHGTHTCVEDKRLQNEGFVFTMICNEKSKLNVGNYIKPHGTNLFFRNLKKLPIVICSKDQLRAYSFPIDYSQPVDDDDNRCPGDVYICPGKDLSSIMARHYFLSKRGKKYLEGIGNDFEEGYNYWSSRKYDGSAKSWPCECRIPTYLILSDEDLYNSKLEK